MAPAGSALQAIQALAAQFPPALLQAQEMNSFEDWPQAVHCFQIFGCSAQDMWASRTPPAEHGGCTASGGAHGTASALVSLALARTNFSSVTEDKHSYRDLNDEASDLAAHLSTQLAPDVTTVPGLPPPRWARSAFDRGVEEAQQLLDLLWSFHEPLMYEHSPERKFHEIAALMPAHKHLILTVGGTEVPEEIVKTAIICAMGPYQEPVTLHAVGLGYKGLARDPLRAFCRLVQSGRSGLSWNVIEHDSEQDLVQWFLREDHAKAPAVFGPPRIVGPDLRRACAAVGGVCWRQLFAREPLETLRRWTETASLCGSSEDVQGFDKLLRGNLRASTQ